MARSVLACERRARELLRRFWVNCSSERWLVQDRAVSKTGADRRTLRLARCRKMLAGSLGSLLGDREAPRAAGYDTSGMGCATCEWRHWAFALQPHACRSSRPLLFGSRRSGRMCPAPRDSPRCRRQDRASLAGRPRGNPSGGHGPLRQIGAIQKHSGLVASSDRITPVLASLRKHWAAGRSVDMKQRETLRCPEMQGTSIAGREAAGLVDVPRGLRGVTR